MSRAVPEYSIDYYGDAVILDPLPHYARMRALGPVVYIPELGQYAVTRFAEAREVLSNWEVYSSASGIAGDEEVCKRARGNTIQSDPPRHTALRSRMIGPLLPPALKEVRPRIEAAAIEIVRASVARPVCDGMDIARHLPLTIVSQLVGLPEEGRRRQLRWAAEGFNLLGSQNARGRQAVGAVAEIQAWLAANTARSVLKAGSWAARIRQLEEDGDIDPNVALMLIFDYTIPSLDTTISAIGEMLYQLGQDNGQLETLRAEPELIPGAVLESIRLASPIRSFTRKVARATTLADHALPEGARIMVMYASANRDEAKFADADRFDVRRNPRDQLGFGFGPHVCAGMHLAKLEMQCLLSAIVAHVEAIEVLSATRALNNIIRSFETLELRLVANVPDAADHRNRPSGCPT